MASTRSAKSYGAAEQVAGAAPESHSKRLTPLLLVGTSCLILALAGFYGCYADTAAPPVTTSPQPTPAANDVLADPDEPVPTPLPTPKAPPLPKTPEGPVEPNPAAVFNGKEFRGVSMQLTSGGEFYNELVEQVAATGSNCIQFVVQAWQENAKSTQIAFGGDKGLSDVRLKELIALARKNKLRVIVMPIVLLSNPGPKEWRGKIDFGRDEQQWDAWWGTYSKYILHYADLAQGSGAEVFTVGSELLKTEFKNERWLKLIEQVRGRFKGYLTYSANWDHYHVPQFWDKLDFVGMTTYHDLIGDDEATDAVMMKSWLDIYRKVLHWQYSVPKPILFTEVSWPNQKTAAKYPWDYYRTEETDPDLQKRCFECFFKTWFGTPTVAGYIVWEWPNYPGASDDPAKDFSYSPRGKPALEVIKHYFAKPDKKDSAGTRPATSPATGPATTPTNRSIATTQSSNAG